MVENALLLAIAGILVVILLLVIYIVARALNDYFDEDKED